jgi:hypothetical protein
MPELSALKSALLRSSRGRVANALLVAGKGFLISVLKTLYSLWLEVTGLIFALLTVAGGSALIRQFRTDHLADRSRFLTVTGFTLVCGWFTVFSFIKARRTRIGQKPPAR